MPGNKPLATLLSRTTAGPLTLGVQLYQTELSAAAPPWKSRSPGWPVDRTDVPATWPLRPRSSRAPASWSLAGGLVVHCRPMLPVAPPKPSTAILYVVPATTGNVIRDCRESVSSLTPCDASAVRPEPVYAARMVSKFDSRVLK